MVAVSTEAYDVLRKVRDRIHETEGKRISLAQTVEVSIIGFLHPAVDLDRTRRTLVSVTAQLLAQLRPDLYEHFKGVAFNERTGEGIVDFGGQGEDARFTAEDPAEALRN